MLFEAEEVRGRCSDVRQTPVAFLERELAARYVIVKDARNLVQGVACLCLEGTVLVDLRHAGLLVDFVHFVSVTVVSRDDSDTTEGVNHREQTGKADVHSFDSHRSCAEGTGVAHHIAVREVAAESLVLAALQGFDHGVGDFGSLHPRALFERNNVGFDFQVGFAVKLAGTVTIPEVGHVAVLLRFGASELLHAGFGKPFAAGFLDCRRRNEEAVRELEVAVVLEHASVADLREALAVKFVEGFFFEGAGDFDGTVATEVEEHHGVAVVDGTDRLAVLCNHERGQVLVNGLGFATEGFDSLRSVVEVAAFAQHVGLPAEFHHLPVSVVTVHGNLHTATAASNANVEFRAAEFVEELFERANVIEGGSFRHVTTVEQNVHADLLEAFLLGLGDHGLEVADVGVNVTVAEEADEVEHAVLGANVLGNFLPGFATEDVAAVDGVCNEGCTLVVNLAGTDSVVAHFGVTHVFVGRHTHGAAVSLQEHVRVHLEEVVESRGAGGLDGVAFDLIGDTKTIHHDGYDRSLDAGEIGKLLEHSLLLLNYGSKFRNFCVRRVQRQMCA